MPLNMFFIKICIFDHSSQLAFLPKPIACSRDMCNAIVSSVFMQNLV